jgi:hypothetical protein
MTATRTRSRAQDNGPKLRRILENWEGTATLYRTVIAGPSGQRADMPAGTVTYCWDGRDMPFELSVTSGYETCGYMMRSVTRDHGEMWATYSYDDWNGYTFEGYATTAALAADVIVNGIHAATGRHDHARTDGARFVARKAQLDR